MRVALSVVVAFLVTTTACHRIAPEPAPAPPSPETPTIAEDDRPQPPLDGAEETEAPADTRRLTPPPAQTEHRDPILDSRWSEHDELLDRVDFWVEFWTTRGADHFHRYLERMHRYQGIVDAELARRGLPESLRYLPIVESGYNPHAVSRVGATGLWQIMQPTAVYLGVSVNRVMDERRDPVVATRAALDYLEELHERFDSWFLALAAYNAGPGRVGRALERVGLDGELSDGSFLEVRGALPAETREFVPRFFAAARLAQDPEGYGFHEINPRPVFVYESAEVPDATSLDVIAASAGVDQEEVEALNPHLVRGFTPAGRRTRVRIPPGTGDRFATNYAQVPPDERASFVEHVVEQGETLTHVAGLYGVALADLRAANGTLDPDRLQIGQRLVIPQGPAAGQEGSAGVRTAAAQGEGEAVRHQVRQGESLWSIARRYQVGVDELRSWNGLGSGAVIHPGEHLTVRGDASAQVHQVASGDTLTSIASRYGVTPRELAQANGLDLGDVIRPGEELTVPGG